MTKILVTCGDPNGIGVEIFLKTLNNTKLKNEIVFIGNKKILEFYANLYNLKIPDIEIIEIDADFFLNPGKIKTINGKFSAKGTETLL